MIREHGIWCIGNMVAFTQDAITRMDMDSGMAQGRTGLHWFLILVLLLVCLLA